MDRFEDVPRGWRGWWTLWWDDVLWIVGGILLWVGLPCLLVAIGG